MGDPIYPQDATKRQTDVDYRSNDGSLVFARSYRSDRMGFQNNYQTVFLPPNPASPGLTPAAPDSTGGCFSSAYSYWDQAIGNTVFVPFCFKYLGSSTTAQVIKSDGFVAQFNWSGTSATSGEAYLNDQVGQTPLPDGTTGWTYYDALADRTLTFDTSGRLLRIQERNGRYQVMTWSTTGTPNAVAPGAGFLISVTDNFNRSLQFAYDARGNMTTLTDPAGHQIIYGYEAVPLSVQTVGGCQGKDCYRLSTVTYPDGGVKTYHWGETANITSPQQGTYNLLTGVSDENGQRYSDTTYKGTQAVSTFLAGGVDKYTFSNVTAYQTTTVTDPLGTVRTFTWGNAQGLVKLATVTGGACPQCEAQAQTFDANGNVASRTDFKGIKTTYVYDLTRNLETSRTEAAGTAQARTITTIWHPTFHLPAQITEPSRVTSYTYDANGNMRTKSVTASGATRCWNYTYNNFGQVLTATDPDSNKTTYTYDTSGNLTTLTDAKGHITQFTSYDANGNLLAMIDPNGKTTSFTWDARNRLTSRQYGSDLTRYTYDLVGQLTSVVFPDGLSVVYTYDAAHRLANIADSQGNSIAYTLDAAGNHMREDVSDPASQLATALAQIAASAKVLDVPGTLK
ncbi:hypothetical protein [Silvimonas sp.]|uniref:RHS repeat domain-containing protein n=1 Tax=Silvimonas sp. TaxID=2650811 RepID=UPI0028469078|nr:hypothetical protein [Silvimonas sp.]MDR3429666.1 hypothetical protein [Silvimonas sp.]